MFDRPGQREEIGKTVWADFLDWWMCVRIGPKVQAGVTVETEWENVEKYDLIVKFLLKN